VIDFNRGPVNPVPPQQKMKFVEQLASCDKFILDRWNFDRTISSVDNDRFHILAIVEGAVKLTANDTAQVLYRGDTVFVPACCKEYAVGTESRAGRRTIKPDGSESAEDVKFILQGNAVLLDMYLP
jgi:mannose-6-phosphate isomerase class I